MIGAGEFTATSARGRLCLVLVSSDTLLGDGFGGALEFGWLFRPLSSLVLLRHPTMALHNGLILWLDAIYEGFVLISLQLAGGGS